MMGLIFISGPHGCGKTTLLHKLEENPAVFVPTLKTDGPKFNTTPLERITLKLAKRAMENYEVLEIARQYPDKVVIGNRCIYDGNAYAEAYKNLGWINDEDEKALRSFGLFIFPQAVREPYSIVLNPPFEVVKKRLEGRWKDSDKKWKEDDSVYLEAACRAFEQFQDSKNVLYIDNTGSVDELERIVRPWLAGHYSRAA